MCTEYGSQGRKSNIGMEWHTSEEARANYQKAHREVRTKMRAAKEEWIEKQCNDIEKGMEAGNSKQAYSTLKALTKTSQPRANVIDDKDGNPLTDSQEVLKRWQNTVAACTTMNSILIPPFFKPTKPPQRAQTAHQS